MRDFTQVYHLDLHGNVRKNPKLSGTTHNVFGIQVGVGITIAVRASSHSPQALFYHRLPEDWRKEQKLAYLREVKVLSDVEWQELLPNERHVWLTEGLQPEFSSYIPLASVGDGKAGSLQDHGIFTTYSPGIISSRDDWVYSFSAANLRQQVLKLIDSYNGEVDRWKREGEPDDVDSFISYDDHQIKWSRDLKADLKRKRYATFEEAKIRRALYRPFATRGC
jgi:predicted helicase